MFTGEYHLSIDDKGRVMIPIKLRFELGENHYLTRAPDKNLMIFPESEWHKQVEYLETLSDNKAITRHVKRFFFTGTGCSFDKHGRILIPPQLRHYANLNKEVVIVGMSKYLELWSAEQWSEITSHIFPRVPSYIEELSNGNNGNF